jgi:hypothetical protein
MIAEYWIEMDLEVNGTGITEVHSGICLEATRKTERTSIKIVGAHCYTKFRSIA